MDPYKTSRMNHAIRRKLSELLQAAIKDPRLEFVSIGAVDLNRDHSVAKVYYSVLGDDGDKERSLAGLKKARGFLQGRLGRSLRLRQTPELRFVYDRSLDRSLDLEQVLSELEERGEFESENQRRRRLQLEDLVPPRDLLAALHGGKQIWVVPHWNPDPDAVGSALAMAGALRALGKEVLVVSYPEPAVGLVDLPGYDLSVPADEAAHVLQEDPPDTILLVDCHRPDRCGPLADVLSGLPNSWTIDHHLISKRQAPVPGWVEARACSTATLVYRVIEELAAGSDEGPSLQLDLDLATCLYAGLLNDTGGFRFPNTTPLTFELARRLTLLGVDPAAVARQTLHRHRRQGLDLLQRTLATFEYAAEGRILSYCVDQEMLAATGTVLADTEGFINLATAVEGVEYVLFLKELEPEVWRVSLRASGGGDVQTVAARHGGGGHRPAAGCTVPGRREDVLATLVSELAETL